MKENTQNKIVIYAKTLNPETFDWRIYDIREDEYNMLIIDGGREFMDVDNNEYLKAIKEAYNDYNSSSLEYYYHNSIAEFVKDILPKKENGKKYTPKEIHDIEKYLKEEDLHTIICKCLSIITGKKYVWTALRGSSQGDYVEAYYPTTYSMKYIEFVEAWYFGTGTEIMVHDSDNEVHEESDIEGFTFYTASYKINDLKEEIKAELGYKKEDNVRVKLWLYKDSTYTRRDNYELVE